MNNTEKSAPPSDANGEHAHKKTQNLFLANITHEFRTPIQTILATLDLLNETHLDGEQIEYTQQVHFAAETLLTLVNDFLDFSKLEMGQFSFEYIPFDPLSVAEQTVNLLAIEAYNKGIEIISDIDYALPPKIIGDPTRTRQILLNLIKNAVKFTPKGYVQVSVSADRAAKTLTCAVKDSGIGIPKEKQQKLFSDFYQTDASNTRKFGGTGLGLAISKNFVTQMGGTITMHDNPDGGSVFEFTLPYRVCDEDEAEPPLLLDGSITQNTRILIVDDQMSACESLQKKLRILGFTDVETSLSGEDSLSRMHLAVQNGAPFTHIFIDMIMPGMDGWRLSSEINQDTAINGAKLFLLIPEGQMGGDAKMKRLKWFNDYLYKPIKKPALVELLQESALDTMELDSVSDEEFSKAIHEQARRSAHRAEDRHAHTEESGTARKHTGTDARARMDGGDGKGGLSAPNGENVARPQFERIAEGRTILIAEDHPVNQKLIKTFFTQFGAAVLCASNGQEAYELATAHREIDLIFMDIQMPIMCGTEATRLIRSANVTAPIIACTANTDKDDFAEYFTAGMNDTLIKPFKKQSVYDIVRLWLGKIGATSTARHDAITASEDGNGIANGNTEAQSSRQSSANTTRRDALTASVDGDGEAVSGTTWGGETMSTVRGDFEAYNSDSACNGETLGAAQRATVTASGANTASTTNAVNRECGENTPNATSAANGASFQVDARGDNAASARQNTADGSNNGFAPRKTTASTRVTGMGARADTNTNTATTTGTHGNNSEKGADTVTGARDVQPSTAAHTGFYGASDETQSSAADEFPITARDTESAESFVSSLVVPSAPEMDSCSIASFNEDAPWLTKNIRFTKDATLKTSAPNRDTQRARTAQSFDKHIWDIDDMLNTASGDYALAKQLVTDFIKQTVTLLEKTALAVSQNRFADIQHFAHAIKGSSASLSVHKLSDMAKQLEIIAKAKNEFACKTCLEECDFCFDEFVQLAEDWISQS